jgi:glucan phosphoethanolaminetransferase (alkaline phosphatase superfamily)
MERKIMESARRRNFFSAFLILVLADLLLLRDRLWLVDNIAGVRFVVNYLLALIGLLALLHLIQKSMRFHPVTRLAAFLVLAVPMISQSAYFSVYRKFITPFGFGFIASDTALTFSLFFRHMQPVRLLAIAAMAFAANRLLFSQVKPARLPVLLLNIVLLSGILVHSVFGWYTVPDFQNGPVACYGALLDNLLRRSGTFRLDKPVVAPVRAQPKADAENIVWIIGESANLSHMGLYGYERNTTPKLLALEKEGKLVALKNAVSVGDKTNLSVPYMLTGLEGPDPNGRFYRTPNIFDYARAARYSTAFISAQDFKWGHMEKILIDANVDFYRDGSSFSSSVDVLKGTDDITVLEKGVLPWLDSARAPFLLVIQMDGSHYPYSEHCPKAYKVFLPEEGENAVNAYDNTIVYLDDCLARIFTEVRSRFPESWIFFSPDHGQNLGGRAGWYNDNYLGNVIHNPLIVFPPGKYHDAILRQEKAPVSQDDIFSTVMAIMDIAPVVPVDGLSLMSDIPKDRIRICSEYMPTFYNNPTATVVFPDYRSYRIDFRKGSVTLDDGKTAMPYSELDPAIKSRLDNRMR